MPHGQPPGGPRSGGSGAGKLVIGLLLVAAAVAVIGIVVLKPFGSPSPGPVALASGGVPQLTLIPTVGPAIVPDASPTAASTTAARTLAPLVSTEPPPTAGPLPTAEPRPTDDPSGALPSCHSDVGFFTVSYPVGWSTLSDGSEWSCMLFDPSPVFVGEATELPDVAVIVRVESTPYARLVKDYKGSPSTSVLQAESGTLGDRDATALELKNNGTGYFEKGVRQTVVIVDLGDPGSLVLEAIGKPGDLYDLRLEGLATILQGLAFD